jgi:hypothetical protein
LAFEHVRERGLKETWGEVGRRAAGIGDIGEQMPIEGVFRKRGHVAIQA